MLAGMIAMVVLFLTGFRIAQEYERALVFRLGRFKAIKGPGLFWIIPLIERQQIVDIRTRTVDFERQETITKDSVTIKVNAVLWFCVIDPEHAVISVANYERAREAEAIREKRARIIKAEAELDASEKLSLSAKKMSETPMALEFRRMQMLSEIGIDNNTTTAILMPSEFQNAAKSFNEFVDIQKGK